MSEYSPSGSPGISTADARPALTPQAIETVLAEFRGWLHEAATESLAPALEHEPEFSWQALVAEFTALRHEVNLQTRAARAQLEQGTQALEQLGQAVAEARESRPSGDEDRENEGEPSTEILRPVLKTLVDVHDAMRLAQREVLRVQQAMELVLARNLTRGVVEIPLENKIAAPDRSVQRWRWWPLASTQERDVPGKQVKEENPSGVQEFRNLLRQTEETWRQTSDQTQQLISSVLVGYTMGLQRIERALAQQELEPIECVGLPFDPECMEVVEVIAEPGRQGTEVIGEVRRGYYWNGKIFRFAQVRVTRP